MKKLFVVLLVVLALVSSSAYAEETANFLLNNEGQVVGQLFGEELNVIPENQGYSQVTGILENGKLIRAKARKQVTIASDVIISGASTVSCTLEVLDTEVINGLLLSTANDVVKSTIVSDPENGVAFHRFIANDGYVVAKLWFGNQYIAIHLADWNQDGSEELCMRAGSMQKSSGNDHVVPTEAPTAMPTQVPTPVPTQVPTPVPTQVPTPVPTQVPTPVPTQVPTPVPTVTPADWNSTPIPANTQKPADWNSTPLPTQTPADWNFGADWNSTPAPTPSPADWNSGNDQNESNGGGWTI